MSNIFENNNKFYKIKKNGELSEALGRPCNSFYEEDRISTLQKIVKFFTESNAISYINAMFNNEQRETALQLYNYIKKYDKNFNAQNLFYDLNGQIIFRTKEHLLVDVFETNKKFRKEIINFMHMLKIEHVDLNRAKLKAVIECYEDKKRDVNKFTERFLFVNSLYEKEKIGASCFAYTFMKTFNDATFEKAINNAMLEKANDNIFFNRTIDFFKDIKND